MDSARVSDLTEAQRACLRGVWEHLGSKEIASGLGISRHTVDDRIKAAMRTLEVSSRREAARLVADYERLLAPQRLVPQSLGLSDITGFPSPQSHGAERGAGTGFIEAEDVADAPLPDISPRSIPLPVPTKGRPTNDLTLWQRLGWIVALTALSIFALGVLLAGLVALSQVT